MKYYQIIADYRPHNQNKPKYLIQASDTIKISEIKKWWNSIYTWLKIYDIIEVEKPNEKENK